VAGNRVQILICRSQTVSKYYSVRAGNACHEMNVIWRQPGLLSDGIGDGAGGLDWGVALAAMLQLQG